MSEETDEILTGRIPETVALYEKIFSRLKKLTRDDLLADGIDAKEANDPSPHAIVSTFWKHESTWSKSTAKLYRAALSYALTQEGTMDAYDAKKVLKRMNFEDIFDEEEREKAINESEMRAEKVKTARDDRLAAIKAGEEKPRTSGQKAKKLSLNDFRNLILQLRDSRSQWADMTAFWLFASQCTGLRPGEWEHASLAYDEKKRTVLIVKNAKHTNGRSFSDERRIILNRLKDHQLQAVRKQIDNARFYGQQGKYKDFYDGCRLLLLSVNQRMWPKRKTHPTLYTARHMFASNAKTTMTKIEVAALMGHSSDRTAGLHYGKRRYATGSVGVEPSENDVKAVAKLNPITESSFDANLRGKGGSGNGSGKEIIYR